MEFWKNIKRRFGVYDTLTSGFKAISESAWIAVYTNNFKDLEGEIITADAHDRYIQRVEKGFTPPPELWVWHMPGTRVGEAKGVWRQGHIVCAYGSFDATPAGKKAAQFFAKGGNYEMSHGFTFPQWGFKEGIYHDYNTFEISVLPTGRAANSFTAFEEVLTMPMTKEREDFLRRVLSDDADSIIKAFNDAESAADSAAKSGLEFKEKHSDYADLTEETTEAAKDNATDAAFAQLLTDLANTTAELAQDVDNGTKAMSNIATEQAALRADMTKALDRLNKLADALQAKLNEAPKSVTGSTHNIVTEEEAEKIEAEKKAAEFEGDPHMLGGDRKPPQLS